MTTIRSIAARNSNAGEQDAQGWAGTASCEAREPHASCCNAHMRAGETRTGTHTDTGTNCAGVLRALQQLTQAQKIGHVPCPQTTCPTLPIDSVESCPLWYLFGCGSKINRRGYAGFGPCFHLPGFHFGAGFLSHGHLYGCHECTSRGRCASRVRSWTRLRVSMRRIQTESMLWIASGASKLWVLSLRHGFAFVFLKAPFSKSILKHQELLRLLDRMSFGTCLWNPGVNMPFVQLWKLGANTSSHRRAVSLRIHVHTWSRARGLGVCDPGGVLQCDGCRDQEGEVFDGYRRFFSFFFGGSRDSTKKGGEGG